MILWLPPSEGKAAPASGPSLNLAELSFPKLTEARSTIIESLQSVSASADAAKYLKLGPKAALEIAHNLTVTTAPCAPAMSVYQGVLYSELDAPSLSSEANARLASSAWIFSALFGAVQPGDSIPNHRLAMGALLPQLGTLSSWWCPHLVAGLPNIEDEPVVDMRSGIYKTPYPGRDVQRVEINAVQPRGGKRRVVSHFAKLWRGRAARNLLETCTGGASLADVLQSLACWRDDGNLHDVEIGETTKTQAGGSLTTVTLVLPSS